MVDLYFETIRSLRAHALRFTLTALGVAWGAFMLTYLTASMEGTHRHFAREFEELGPGLVHVGGGRVLKERVGERGARPVELETEDIDRLSELRSIAGITPVIELWASVVRANGRTRLLHVEGINANAETIRNLPTQRGRFLSPLDLERRARVAVIGPDTADRLFGTVDVVGRYLQIESLRFRIVGVSIAKGEQLMNTGDPDDLKVWVPYTTAQRWFARSEAVDRAVFLPRVRERSREAIRHVRQVTSLHHPFDADVESALWFFDSGEALAPISAGIGALRVFVAAAGAITLLVGAVGVMNIMFVVVGERRREIGLRKAVGASSRAIFIQFLAEAVSVSSLAALAGSALGIALTRVIERIAPEGSPLHSVPVTEPATVAAIAGSLILVGLVSGVAPALRAARVAPADALRSH